MLIDLTPEQIRALANAAQETLDDPFKNTEAWPPMLIEALESAADLLEAYCQPMPEPPCGGQCFGGTPMVEPPPPMPYDPMTAPIDEASIVRLAQQCLAPLVYIINPPGYQEALDNVIDAIRGAYQGGLAVQRERSVLDAGREAPAVSDDLPF